MEFRKLKFLGAGANGNVFLAAPCRPCDDLVCPSLFAVKSANCLSTTLKREKMFLDELFGSCYIVECFGHNVSIEEGRRVYNVMMEYASGGTLKSLIESRGGRMEEREVAYYSRMLLLGLSSAHKKGIVHCDLKPDNVLVFPREEETYHLLKIADFGNAKKVWEKEMHEPGRASNHRGTLRYASPESVMYGIHGKPTDIWSLGCVILEMLTGQRVWGANSTCVEIILKLMLMKPEIPEFVSNIGTDFLDKCFEKNPEKRWTISMLMRHKFIDDNFSCDVRFGGCRTNDYSDIDWSFSLPQR
ncbi:hypothetical protein Leryth_011875 [Lithospermum erythrorhizon]|uniref:Protein kinase domain-containing protein n=1 Tax=Lithospermum erythrorhizon TaxID=34254 RepID=A0AAV3NYA9_LITER|nr:hypothetical protein Leryth_011875 [Lithospermum erythrorhizon]